MATAQWDAIIIGAGPAGLAAATTLADHGCTVMLADEQDAPGGQIYRAIEKTSGRKALFKALGPDYAHGLGLVQALRASKVHYQPRSSVWQVTTRREVDLLSQGRSQRHNARAIVVATGAMERPCPVPGWTLPAVMTAGALQVLIKSAAVVPDGNYVLAGSGPLLYLLASQCLALGSRPAAIVDTMPRSNYVDAAPKLPRALTGHGPRYLWKGVKLLAALRLAGIPIFTGAHDLHILGDQHANGLAFTCAGKFHTLACDTIALHEGVIPHPQLARSLNVEHRWDPVQRAFAPALDNWGESTREGIFFAGDGAGISGARAAEIQGRIAALQVLVRLGKLDSAAALAQAEIWRRQAKAHLSVRPFLDTLYTPRKDLYTPPDATVICRCEEVSAGQVRQAVGNGCLGPNQVKSFLRTGMGPCQGCLCGATVVELIADAANMTPAEVGYYHIRPPLKPLTVGELLSADKPAT